MHEIISQWEENSSSIFFLFNFFIYFPWYRSYFSWSKACHEIYSIWNAFWSSIYWWIYSLQKLLTIITYYVNKNQVTCLLFSVSSVKEGLFAIGKFTRGQIWKCSTTIIKDLYTNKVNCVKQKYHGALLNVPCVCISFRKSYGIYSYLLLSLIIIFFINYKSFF